MDFIKNIIKMFNKSLDQKPKYINNDGIEMVDIMQNMYNGTYRFNLIHSIYKANIKCTMRPDYLAACLYGDEAYAEVVMKSSMLSNPFALEKNDIIYAMKIDDLYNNINVTPEEQTNSLFELIKRYHKYIDPDKVPDTVGSEENQVKPTKGGIEPNISKTGETGVTIKNGKIYFGKNNTVSDTLNNAEQEEIIEGVSAIGTGSLSDYTVKSTISVNDDNSLHFNLDDDIEENYSQEILDRISSDNNDIILDDGKIYFGDNDIERDLKIPVDSSSIDCARSGVSLGEFINAAVNSCNINVNDIE